MELYGRNKSFMQLSTRRKTEIMTPYKLMDLAEVQLKNLDITSTNDSVDANMQIKRRNGTIQKDFFSALEYLTWGTRTQIELPYYQSKCNKKSSLLDAFIFD